jgi:hypothetical protein
MTGVTVGVIAAGSVQGTSRTALAVIATLLTVAGVMRAFRLSVSATSTSVSIRNYIRSYDFEWADVAAVGIGMKTMGVVPQSAFAFLVSVHGKERELRAQATPIDGSDRDDALTELQQLAPPGVRFVPPS